jgi:hypothetical protein
VPRLDSPQKFVALIVSHPEIASLCDVACSFLKTGAVRVESDSPLINDLLTLPFRSPETAQRGIFSLPLNTPSPSIVNILDTLFNLSIEL